LLTLQKRKAEKFKSLAHRLGSPQLPYGWRRLPQRLVDDLAPLSTLDNGTMILQWITFRLTREAAT
jgi:hypothetical protein